MFQVTGEVINMFKSPASEKYEESYKVQILGENQLQDGQVKKEMLTLGVPRTVYDSLQGSTGRTITLPIGFYIKAGQLITYFPKSSAVPLTAPAV